MSKSPPGSTGPDIPEHLKQWRGLFMRRGGQIVDALPEDVDVAKSYASAETKGAVKNGRRITILCRKQTYYTGEDVRVIHVFEAVEPGHEVPIMGPKPVLGESVDGRLATPENTGTDSIYDGPMLPSPAVDYNYDITSYSFATPGRHTIDWRLGELRSNVLELEVVAR